MQKTKREDAGNFEDFKVCGVDVEKVCHQLACAKPGMNCDRHEMVDLQLSVDVYRGRLRLAVIAYSI